VLVGTLKRALPLDQIPLPYSGWRDEARYRAPLQMKPERRPTAVVVVARFRARLLVL